MPVVRLLPGIPGVTRQKEIETPEGSLVKVLSIVEQREGLELVRHAREGELLVTVNGRAAKNLDEKAKGEDLVVVAPVVLGG